MSRIRADRYTNREGTGAPTFSDGVNVVGVTSMSGDLAVTNGTITGSSQLTISGITSSISDTAADVFVYDTSKDSDGGAWRKRTQNTSWYNETLNTSTRGSRKEFPAVAVIVAETTKVTIYDGDDPDLPMWMVFNVANDTWLKLYSSAPQCSCITALNGILCAGGNGTGIRLAVVDFIKDDQYLTEAGHTYYQTTKGIITRNDVTSHSSDGGSKSIVNNVVNDVAMTVLPNAPIDSATGLPVPTIAVATNGGVSVIKDNGTVVDITGQTEAPYRITFNRSNPNEIITSGYWTRVMKVYEIPSSDASESTQLRYYVDSQTPKIPFGSGAMDFESTQNEELIVKVTGGTPSNGFYRIAENLESKTNGMTAYIRSDCNTGWMHGDIKGAFLSDTDDTNKTNGQTDPDRSVNNNPLTVYGTITKTPVATGADLVAYSGWGPSNYLQQPYNSDLDFGTNDFSIMGWINVTGSETMQGLIHRNTPGTATDAGFLMEYRHDNDYILIQLDNGSSVNNLFSANNSIQANVWTHFCAVVKNSGKRMEIYINGKLSNSSNFGSARNVTNTSAVTLIGREIHEGAQSNRYFDGSISLLRISGSSPSPEQIKKIYEDEKILFQENAKATLYGSSDAVTALAFDDDTNLLHVGTSSGRSEFQGLRRINNTTDAVTTAISASNGLVAEQ